MDPAAWLQQALDELLELARVAGDDPGDAWRQSALIARLLGSPSGPAPPAEAVQRLPELLSVAGVPDPQRLLDRIAEELDAESDPWGLLLDGLLDIDDALGVLGTNGETDVTSALARRVAGLLSLYPERVIVLAPFAEMRLQTVREGAAAAVLWSAVERAPAHLLVGALPPAAGGTARSWQVPPAESRSSPARDLSFCIPPELHSAAAASDSAEVRTIEEGGQHAWLYQEMGRMRLEAKGVASRAATAVLVAERAKDGSVLLQAALDIEVSGDTVYADLGPWAGPENALHRLIGRTGLAPTEVRIRLILSNG